MSFFPFELSRAKGRKATLFLFTYGESGSHFAYTDHEQSITVGGKTYTPAAIKRNKIVMKASGDRQNLEVRMALGLPLAELFRIFPPASVVNLVVREGHLNDADADFKTVWHGRVTGQSRESPELVLTCEPMRTALRRFGLRRYYQYSCPHMLFSTSCGASEAAATVSATVAEITGNTVRLVAGWTTTHGRYSSGMMKWVNSEGDTEVRTIIRMATNGVVLGALPRDLAVGDTVSMVRGCSRTMEGCNQHSNIQNFGGCPFIPKKNPIGKTSLFY